MTTIAALAMVELTEGASVSQSRSVKCPPRGFGRELLTHADNISTHRIAKRQISSDGNKDIEKRSDPCTCHYNAGGPEVGIVADFIEHGEHLSSVSAGLELLLLPEVTGS